MEKVVLGRTDLEVSRLGAGQSQIGFHLDESKMEQAGRALNVFLDNGINFIDTAACYGISHKAMGKYISHRRDEFILATKTGHHLEGYNLLVGRPWSADTIKRSVEQSLTDLRTDYVDILQLHSCTVPVLERGEAVETILRMKEEGKTRFIGYSGDADGAEWAIASGVFDTLQITYNLIDQGAEARIIPAAMEKNIGVIVKRPIANGAWGSSGPPQSYPDNPDELPAMHDYWQRYLAMIEEGPIEGLPADGIYVAMAFIFANPGVHTAIIGTKNPDHIRANVKMFEAGLTLSQSHVEELRRRFQDVGYFWNTVR